MNDLQIGILKTLAYSAVFRFPLLKNEIYKYWVGSGPVGSKQINLELEKLTKQGKISKTGNYYFLKNYLQVDRKTRNKIALRKNKIASQKIKTISFLPTIKMIAITGSLAAQNSKESDDIDLLIITKCGYVWLTRLFSTLLLEVFGGRRRPADQDITDKICLNMYLDETSLAIPKKGQTLYVAREIAQMKVIYNHSNTYEKFLSQNLWIKNLLPNALVYEKSKIDYKKSQNKKFNTNLIEKLVYRAQIKIMKNKITTEIVEPKQIRFHPNDYSKKTLADYQEILKKYGL